MIKTNMEKHNFSEFEIKKQKRQFLPWWIKFFCWFFMMTGILAIVVIILNLFSIHADLGIYGFDVKEGKLVNNLLVFVSFILNGIVGYFLWFEKKNAILLAIFCSIWGILVCLLSIILGMFIFKTGISFRLEILFLLLFLFKLLKIRKEFKY